MPDWQERITRETEPEIRVEHQLRYELAAPAVEQAHVWADLGCGNGVAAAAALRGRMPARAVLVDLDERAVATAREETGIEDAVALQADLSSPADLERVRAALLSGDGGGGVVTCFETVEHLPTFVPLLELLVDLAEQHGFTVFLSVPNDAFWSIDNPHHVGAWGEGAFEELRRLLPAEHVLVKQVPLSGSALVDAAQEAAPPRTVEVELDPAGVPTHLLAGFGPERGLLQPAARATQTDLVEQRRWVRQRESDLTYMKEYLAENERMSGEFAEWRAYIHELERRLGEPLSGVDPDEQPGQ